MSDLSPEVFTADYAGEPGHRAFFLQVQTGGILQSYGLEKQQLQALAEKLHEMLVAIDPSDTITGARPARDPALAAAPDDPDFRIGSVGLAFDEDADRFLIVVEEVAAEDEPPAVEPAGAVRFSLRRDQVRAFVLHAIAVVAEGRPLCQLCGLPIDPEGHVCPASNGHHANV